jgi:hypothetical protein
MCSGQGPRGKRALASQTLEDEPDTGAVRNEAHLTLFL